jgi:hypothetical protein
MKPPAPSLKHPIARLFCLAVATVALVSFVACKAEVNIAVDEEGIGEIELVAALNDAILSLASMAGEDPFEEFFSIPVEQLETEGLEGAIIESYSQAGYTGISIRARFDPYDPTLAVMSDGDSMLGNLTEDIGLDGFRFIRTEQDDGWVVQLDQSAEPSIAEGFDDLPSDIPFDMDDLQLPFIFSLKLPGEYVEHNADREVDGVLIWDTTLVEGINISAVSRDPGTQFELVPIIITAVFAAIFLGIVIGVVVSRERRRRRADEDAALEAESEGPIATRC